MKRMAYHSNPNEIYGVPLKSKWNLWRTTQSPMKFMAYHWNPQEIYGVLLKSYKVHIPSADSPTPNPGPPPSAGKIHNQTRLLLLVLLLLSPHGKVGSAGNEMYGVPLKWFNPNEIYGVPLKSKWNLKPCTRWAPIGKGERLNFS